MQDGIDIVKYIFFAYTFVAVMLADFVGPPVGYVVEAGAVGGVAVEGETLTITRKV